MCGQLLSGPKAPEDADAEHARRPGGLHICIGIAEIQELRRRDVHFFGDLKRCRWIGFDRDGWSSAADDVK